jgi:predicted TIM-barrel fold metal-dependent hydrolase
MSLGDAAAVREQLGHPVVDIDGHTIEYFPVLDGYLREEGVDPSSPALRRMLPGAFGPPASWHALSGDQRAARRVARPPWWGAPMRNTRDLATAMFPRLLHERLDELGIDFGVVYPSLGLNLMHIGDDDVRRGACRALNRANADAFAPYRDRLAPVAAIPMVTPAEAVDAIEHAVTELGFRAVLLQGYVQRPVGALAGRDGELSQYATWLDMYGIDSAYDYDPVWAACVRLGVPVSFHSGSIGWGSRLSVSNYMYNHIGHLAEGHHALCKSLFLGGVTRRFPELRFAFLEGGVSWAASLYAELIGHWEKRNLAALGNYDPRHLDRAEFGRLMAEYAPDWLQIAQKARVGLGGAPEDPATLDEWAACEIEKAEDIRDLFVPNFFFGCEADDPLTTTAFNTRVNPFGARLHAMFGSDIAHWDVPDMAGVLCEAWELVEDGLVSEADFRDFVFANPVRFFGGPGSRFFEGTAIEGDVAALADAG